MIKEQCSHTYIYTKEEMDDIIENYCIPVWEANNTDKMARFGFVLACIVDYSVKRKRIEIEENKKCTDELIRIIKMQTEADAL